ncbi:hypothetical protein SEA_FORZA_67 [Gordonia phage Forza]|uniref:Uncharacterized protein n=1 Tax=Gordonia phage Forza TaxID=2571247 RepID=A0A650EYD0_9CAUD|nr:hypothetical protein PP303_gp067 [Gordonia phage Forza]QEM41536.1 hypothetical protein SEA_BOOPY_67 [Gordonia phage Boopy]QGT55060.1 hypothetical protein SEA_FORZA_67 [Gordonia phage Forza]UXE04209.1 hypothetical protein SEA_BLUENGOLD_65 [Gordonia phage BlueNGold]WBF03848.1 hypothetical protein SEA_MAREELIH_65 [Gordonia phage Mareelih]
MSFAKTGRYKVGDEVHLFNQEQTRRVHPFMDWDVVSIMTLKDKNRNPYRLYVVRGRWIENRMNGRRSVRRERTTYRQVRASRLRKVG